MARSTLAGLIALLCPLLLGAQQPSPQLKQAAELVNTGLQLTRQGWQLFQEACAANTLNAQASLGLQTATAADQAYQSASGLLDAVRNEA